MHTGKRRLVLVREAVGPPIQAMDQSVSLWTNINGQATGQAQLDKHYALAGQAVYSDLKLAQLICNLRQAAS